jgi:hypothetical protein
MTRLSEDLPARVRAQPQRKPGGLELPGILYWLSILLLVWGGQTLIDPSNRVSGEVWHIHVALIAFEVYIWLLLAVARWQTARNLIRDAARFGMFAIFLQGAIFVAISELHMAAQAQGLEVAVVAVVLAVTKLILGTRWLRVPLPIPLGASCVIWIVAMAVPGIVIRAFGIDYSAKSYTIDYAAQHVTAFISCWVLALLAGFHVPLVRWQMRRGFRSPAGLRPWWTPWAVSAGLLVMAVAQLYTAMWGQSVDWSQWFFAPVYLAMAVTAVALSSAAGRRRPVAWALLAAAIAFVAITYQQPTPERFPPEWAGYVGRYLVHPLYPAAAYFMLLMAATAVTLGQYLFFVAAVAPALIAGVGKLVSILNRPASDWSRKTFDAVADFRHSKAVGMLLGAFVLLGLGVLLQWLREREKSRRDASSPADGDE